MGQAMRAALGACIVAVTPDVAFEPDLGMRLRRRAEAAASMARGIRLG
jgi:hypothetical protein